MTMNRSIKFSIIIPVFNSEEYLMNCLSSLLSRNVERYEVIIINDGSTDNSRRIIDSCKLEYSNITVIHQENQGVSVARNNGIKSAKGEYILFLDSDDEFEENIFNDLEISLQKFNYPDMVSFGYERKSGLNKTSKKYSCKQYASQIFSGQDFTQLFLSKKISQHVCSVLIKRKILSSKEILFNPKITLGEDIAFQIKVMSSVKNVVYLANTYFIYNYNEESQTNKEYVNNHLSCIQNYQDVNNFIIQHDLKGIQRYLTFYYQFMFFYELQFFLKASPSTLDKYLISERILKEKTVFLFNKSYFINLTLKILYGINRKLVFFILNKGK